MLTVIKNYGIGDITSSIKSFLEKSVHSEIVRELAVEVTSGSQDPIYSIYEWVKSNIKYTPDPVLAGEDVELFISPIRMVKDYREGKALGGDCDDIAITTTALLQAVGIKSNVVLLDTDGKGYDHAVSRAFSEKLNEWVTVDASSCAPLGWEEKCYNRLIIH